MVPGAKNLSLQRYGRFGLCRLFFVAGFNSSSASTSASTAMGNWCSSVASFILSAFTVWITKIIVDSDALPDQSQQISGPSSPVVSQKGFGLATIVRRAASAASVAAKQAYAAAAAAASRNSDEEMLPLKCCLMSVSFPWEHIAYDLLFKGGPTVNL